MLSGLQESVGRPIAYIDNDPANKTDPTGMQPSDDADMSAPPANPCAPYLADSPGYMWWDPTTGSCLVINPNLRQTSDQRIECIREALFHQTFLASTGQEQLRACIAAGRWGPDVAGWEFGVATAQEHNAMRHFVVAALLGYEAGEYNGVLPLIVHEIYGAGCPASPEECLLDSAADYVNNTLGLRYGDSIRVEFVADNEPALVKDVVDEGYRLLANGRLDRRGGCPKYAAEHGITPDKFVSPIGGLPC